MCDLYMNNFTFLDQNQIFENYHFDRLDIIKKYGTKCAITDFSILLGGLVSSKNYVDNTKEKKERTGCWWTKTEDFEHEYAYAVLDDGLKDYDWRKARDRIFVFRRDIGARPAFNLSNFPLDELKEVNGIKEFEYGEYPQTVVDKDYSRELEDAYNNGSLKVTGKNYTTDSVKVKYTGVSFVPRNHIEYEYKGNKYIRFVGDSNCARKVLSDGRRVRSGKPYWVRVEPITWLIDEKTGLALSKKIIFSGVQFKDNDYPCEFNNTNIQKFMNEYFSKDILPYNDYQQNQQINSDIKEVISDKSYQTTMLEKQEKLKEQITNQQTIYGFNMNKVSEKDIIKAAIESNVPIFLHGKYGEGKSAIVEQLDSDCEIVYARNATLDSLNGNSVYNDTTKEIIDVPPTWYTNLKVKCEAKPDKIHIIFFEDITNAINSIQNAIFNIAKDGKVNDKWKLPSNARIVVSSNKTLTAEQTEEPFAYVYVNNTVEDWLKWAITPKEENQEIKIHPSIYAYIAYKFYGGENVLRTSYTGDKSNTNPRKWEMASKLLYKTKQPEMLRALIGEDLTKDFVKFATQPVICVDDLINHDYSRRYLEMTLSEKFATAVALSSVDDEHFDDIRNFMEQVGEKPKEVFESLWAYGNKERLEKIIEINSNLSKGGMRR